MTDYPARKHPRLKGYDYGQNGAYFVTVCTDKRQCILSEIAVGRGLAPAVRLLSAGRIVAEELDALLDRFPGLAIEKSVIMPNHIHLLLRLTAAGASPRPTPSEEAYTVVDVVRVLKSLTTRRWNAARGRTGERLWQSSFHDHVIRDENDFLSRWSYIEGNPARWAEDEYDTGKGT